MNGPKITVLAPGADPTLIRGRHHHFHGVVKLVSDLDISTTIAKDADIKMRVGFVHDTQHAQFNGRFRATSFGDRKNLPGRKPEHTEALLEHADRAQVIVEPPAEPTQEAPSV